MKGLSVLVDETLKRQVQVRAKGQHRSPSDQVRRYLEIALVAEDNPDLPFSFISRLLEAEAEREAGMVEEADWSVR